MCGSHTPRCGHIWTQTLTRTYTQRNTQVHVIYASWQKHGWGCKTMRRKSERGDERQRGLPYCPQWLGHSIDQRREGKAGWDWEGKNRPQGSGPNSLVASALFLSCKLARAVGRYIKGSYPSICPIRIHTNTHINACTIIPLAFEKWSIWWSFPLLFHC